MKRPIYKKQDRACPNIVKPCEDKEEVSLVDKAMIYFLWVYLTVIIVITLYSLL